MSTLTDELKKQQKIYNNKKKSVEYLHIHSSEKEIYKGIYHPSANQIHIITTDKDARNRSETERVSSLVHENGHKENSNVYHLQMSPSQIYQVNQCDEIGQTIRKLLYRRNEYLKTKDLDVFNEFDKKFSFYIEAINNKEISPSEAAHDREKFDQEMSFIMNKTQEQWNKEYGTIYDDQSNLCAKEYFCRVSHHALPNENNYNKAINQILTIGGVNFNQYRKQDFTCDSDEINQISKLVQTGNQAQINTMRQNLIDEGVPVHAALQASPQQKKKDT